MRRSSPWAVSTALALSFFAAGGAQSRGAEPTAWNGSGDRGRAAAALVPFLPSFVAAPHLFGTPEDYQLKRHRPRPVPPRLNHDLLFHGGTVLTANNTLAIFWGGQWNDSGFAADLISGVDTFLAGFGGSRYAGSSTEYFGINGRVTRTSTYFGHVIDPSPAPDGEVPTEAIAAEVCKVTSSSPDPNALYLVYTETGLGPGKHAYCAWHTAAHCANGAPVLFSHIPDLRQTSACQYADVDAGHSHGLAWAIDATAHELSETITDPRLDAWFDADYNENGDKCAYIFQQPVTLSNGSVWSVQTLWSNRAYDSGTGVPSHDGLKGCVQGQ